MALRISEIQAVIVIDTKQYEQALKQAEGSAKGFAQGAGKEFKRGTVYLKEMAEAAKMSEKEFSKLKYSARDVLSVIFPRGIGSIARSFLPLGTITGAIYGLINAESEAEKTAKKYGTTLDALREKYAAVADSALSAAEKTNKFTEAQSRAVSLEVQKLEKAIEQSRAKLQEFTDFDSYYAAGSSAFGLLIKNVQFSSGEVESLRKQAQALFKGIEDGKPATEEVGTAFSNIIASLRLLEQEDGGFSTKAQEAKRLRERAEEALGPLDALVGAFIKLANLSMRSAKVDEYVDTWAKVAKERLGLEKDIQTAFAKTKEGQVEAAKSSVDASRAQLERAKAQSLSADTIAQAEVNLRKAEKDLADKLNPSGSAGSSGSTNKLATVIHSIEAEIARLSMTEKDYARFQLDQKIAEWSKVKDVTDDVLNRYRELAEAELNKKSFDEASKAIQEFEKEYQQTFKNSGNLFASVATEMEKFRDAAKAAGMSAEELEAILQRISELQARRLVDAATDAASGAVRGFRNYAEEARNAAKDAETAIGNGLSSMEDALVSFAKTGKLSFSSMVDSMISDIARLAVRQSITGPLSSALGSLFGSGASSWTSSAQGAAGWIQSEKGNVFSSPALSSYSNSIVDRPTVFPFAKGGIGLMGEAGAEAIMPLTRTSKGDLGVRADISGGSQTPQVNIQIVDQRGANAPEVEVQQAPNASGGIDFKLIIKAEQQRNFSSGSMDSIMRNRYGIRPQVVGR